jgi:asparagine synthase (glutamine-hydrolysing)
MHRIAGWLGHEHLDNAIALNAMLAKASVPATSLKLNLPGMAASTSLSVAEEDGLAAVICGRPRFDEAELAALSPAQALLRLWRDLGRSAPSRIHGNFALALLDRRRQEAFLALDRIGAEKLTFATSEAGLVFASQADMTAAHPEVGARVDPQALFNYFYFYQVPAPGSIFQGVEKLLPAQWVHWRQGQVERGFYWALSYRDETRSDFDAQSARFHSLLRECVGRARGRDQVAAFLSGGTDSSTVSGVLKELAGSAQTFSIGFDAQGYDEIEYARMAARRFGLDSREYYIKPQDIVDAIPIIVRHYDEPFANESAVPTYYCAKLAAEHGFHVMLAGDGGDEIFGGNERYAKQKVFEAYYALPGALRSGVIEPLTRMPGVQAIPPLRKLQSYVRQATIPLPTRMESYNFIYRQPLEEMFQEGFLQKVNPGQPHDWLKEVYDRADSDSFINRMLHLDLKFTLADNDLRKVGGMTEAAGVEVRYPLLDDAMVEFSGEVPPDWKVKRLYLRWFFKQALKGFLPDEIINKSKHGFGLPFGIWARDYAPLRERIETALAAFKRRGILRPEYIDHMQTQHMAGYAHYYGRMLWFILVLEEWLAWRGL